MKMRNKNNNGIKNENKAKISQRKCSEMQTNARRSKQLKIEDMVLHKKVILSTLGFRWEWESFSWHPHSHSYLGKREGEKKHMAEICPPCLRVIVDFMKHNGFGLPDPVLSWACCPQLWLAGLKLDLASALDHFHIWTTGKGSSCSCLSQQKALALH